MSFSQLEYVRHMFVEAEFLAEQSRRVTRDHFLNDEVLRPDYEIVLNVVANESHLLKAAPGHILSDTLPE